ncbi:hypothetical protein SERLA73DRAFT_146352 [Serpula lacrymans var. lacrymans S7.3]|uniref:Uncharacterized protein n=1 Tax=Serpula lacrymans var. lacrymans (strain S7.3) TaxID=936435 RepID=F8QFH6_SERL3|nr:hypothetical protein SERLA73DRAFT_146352 [Serpula lacrymans var. lacrymans S7.3]
MAAGIFAVDPEPHEKSTNGVETAVETEHDRQAEVSPSQKAYKVRTTLKPSMNKIIQIRYFSHFESPGNLVL